MLILNKNQNYVISITSGKLYQMKCLHDYLFSGAAVKTFIVHIVLNLSNFCISLTLFDDMTSDTGLNIYPSYNIKKMTIKQAYYI